MCLVLKALVINVLCYLSCARKTYSEYTIIASSISIYNSDKIREAKDILYKFIGETAVRRRRDNRIRSDVLEKLEVMKALTQVPLR